MHTILESIIQNSIEKKSFFFTSIKQKSLKHQMEFLI